MLEQPAVRTLETIANTLVGLGRYSSQTDAIRAIALEQINRKIAFYERRVKNFERKHRVSFEIFTKRLQRRATIPQEDEWMDWEAARDLLAEWQNARKAIEN
jgi:Arc/MetJ-type ribon-helix-helix transcriptional regulator